MLSHSIRLGPLARLVALALLALAASASTSAGPRSLRRRDGLRPVFAHVVQGDFQTYSQDDYAADMALALSAGIDAFALNVGRDASDGAQLDKAFAAAESIGFRCFFSLDMNYFNREGASAAILDEYIGKYGAREGHFEWDGKAFLSTFSGEVPGTFLDGAPSFDDSNAKWTVVLDQAKDKIGKEIYFAPDWNDVALVPKNTWGGGIMSWAAWGDKGRTNDMTLSQDESYLAAAAAAGLDYLAPVAAFFYVHVAAGNNYVLQSNDFLLPKHYEDLISLNPGPAFVELLSWNDFGEAHYLGPVRQSAGIPEGAKDYVNTASSDHTPMLWLSAYWNIWFKSGSPPAITSEAVIYWYRPHPASATASDDPIAKPEFADTLEDKIQAVVFVPPGSKAARLVVTTGGKETEPQAVKEGVNLISVNFAAGATGVSLQDADGNELLGGSGKDIVDSPTTYDYNHYAYILPSDATAPTFLDGLAPSSESSSSSVPPLNAVSSTGTAAGVVSSSRSVGTLGMATTSATSSPPTTGDGSGGSSSSGSGSSGSSNSPGSSGGSSHGDDDSSYSNTFSDATAFLAADGWLGLPNWTWLLLALVVPLGAVGVFLATRHGSETPEDEGGDSDERDVRHDDGDDKEDDALRRNVSESSSSDTDSDS